MRIERPSAPLSGAEELRNQTTEQERKQSAFTILMAERGGWGSPNMIMVLNSVRTIFRDVPEVLDNWYKLNTEPSDNRRYFDLVEAIAKHMAIPIRREDIEL
jgi:hypothetical protein